LHIRPLPLSTLFPYTTLFRSPAMVLIDSIVRLLPGVLKSEESYLDESHYNGLLEYPQYTRPREFNGFSVPKILLSGDHKKIQEWRYNKSLEATLLKRPDLLENINLGKKKQLLLNNLNDDID